MLNISFKTHNSIYELHKERVTFGSSLENAILLYNNNHTTKISKIYTLQGQEISRDLWSICLKDNMDFYIDSIIE